MRIANYLFTAFVLTMTACQPPGTKGALDDEFSSLSGVDEKSDVFSKKLQLLGDLKYGQTSAAANYANPPRYNGYSFSGTAGDPVDIWVRSTTGDAVAWLLTSKYGIVASNDDGDPTTSDSRLQAKLPKTGKYYVVYREYKLHSTSFTVELGGPVVCTPTSCAAQGKNCGSLDDGCGGMLDCGGCANDQTCGANGNSNVCGTVDPFDPNSCTGPSMTLAEAKNRYGASPRNGSDWRPLGVRTLVHMRHIYCPDGVCQPWVVDAPDPTQTVELLLTPTGGDLSNLDLYISAPVNGTAPTCQGTIETEPQVCQYEYGPNSTFTGNITNHCARLSQQIRHVDGPGTSDFGTLRSIVERVIYVTF